MDAYSLFTLITQYIEEYRFLGYWIVALGSFAEAIPFSGLLVPGNIMLAIAGVLAYEGYLEAAPLLALAVIGAILGDMFGYYLGVKYNGKQKLIDIENKDKYPLKRKYLEKAERFCQKHGGKSVFFGRFIGPLRPFVAFIAGIGHMPFASFMYYNIASAFLWAFGFFFLGYFVEGSLKMIKSIEHIMIFGAIALGIVFVIRWFFKKEIALDLAEETAPELQKEEKFNRIDK